MKTAREIAHGHESGGLGRCVGSLETKRGEDIHSRPCDHLTATIEAALAASRAELDALKVDVERLTRQAEIDITVGQAGTRLLAESNAERDAARDELATKRAEVAALRRSLAEADAAAGSLERARLALRAVRDELKNHALLPVLQRQIRDLLAAPPTPIATPGTPNR